MPLDYYKRDHLKVPSVYPPISRSQDANPSCVVPVHSLSCNLPRKSVISVCPPLLWETISCAKFVGLQEEGVSLQQSRIWTGCSLLASGKGFLCIPKVLGPGTLPNQSWSHFWEALPVQHQRPAAWEAFSTSVAQGWFINVITRRPFSYSQILNFLFVMDTRKSYSPGFQGNIDQKIQSFIVSGSKQ